MAPSDTTTRSNSDTPTIALVLSGGGARGAYEAGVLSYLFEDLPARLGQPVRFDILTGTSVGAVHACYCAAMQGLPDAGEKLEAIWQSLSLDRVFAPGFGDLFRVPLQLIGFASERPALPPTKSGVPERLPGLFDTGWLEDDRHPEHRLVSNPRAARQRLDTSARDRSHRDQHRTLRGVRRHRRPPDARVARG